MRRLSLDQLQQPPPQHPVAGAVARPVGPGVAPDNATVESSRTVSLCPDGHCAGSREAVIGRVSSKVVEHSRQRNS